MIDTSVDTSTLNLFGRSVLYTSVETVDRTNVESLLQSALMTHITNSTNIDYLYKYYKGNQPILERTKTVRPDILNKVVENHAYEIVSFKTGYVFGEPIQYVRKGKGKTKDEGVSKKVSVLNDYMAVNDKAEQDKQLSEWFYICGTAYRMILPSKNNTDTPFEIDVLDPRFTFVVYNNGFGKKPVMGVKYITDVSGVTTYSVYTPNEYFEIVNSAITKQESHTLGVIPIIEYPANTSRLGSFEIVLGLLDALNEATSNRMDGIEQFVQAFVKFINCDISTEDFEKLKDMGAIKIKGEVGLPADVDIVSKELSQSQIQVNVDYLYQTVLIICGMPERQSGSGGGDTGQAVILRDGWTSAEARARDTELVFKCSEKKFLSLVLKILKTTEQLNIDLKDIEIKFTRNKTDNLLVKTQGLQNMLEAGINPQIAISHSGLFSDPEQTYLDSVKYLTKWLTDTTQNQNTPPNNKSTDEKSTSDPEPDLENPFKDTNTGGVT